MALASLSPTVPGSKPKKTLDQTRDVWSSKSGRPAKDFESCETVSIAESARYPLVRCPAQLVTRLLIAFANGTSSRPAAWRSVGFNAMHMRPAHCLLSPALYYAVL